PPPPPPPPPLSLHDALPISAGAVDGRAKRRGRARDGGDCPLRIHASRRRPHQRRRRRSRRDSESSNDRQDRCCDRDVGPAPKKGDRKSTRLNSSHSQNSYAV